MTYTKYVTSWDAPRLKQVMELRDQGHSNHEVAEMLGLHITTISGAITACHQKYGWRPPKKPRTVTLTEREHAVLALYTQGYKSPHIADLLILSYRSVEGAISRCVTKLGLNNRQELIDYALDERE